MNYFKKTASKIILLWLSWLLIILSFQYFADLRLNPHRPDRATNWTADETRRSSQNNKPYLIGDFLNRQLSWDSEFYLSIAMNGYDDPTIETVSVNEQEYSLNYAFFPLYPITIRMMNLPISLLGMEKLATTTLSGVIVSALSILAAMFALHDLAKNWLDKNQSWNLLFYLLIFPSSFFFLMIYTEALFLALTLWTLAFGKRRKWIIAGIFAALATMTRATGALTLIALFVWFLQDNPIKALQEKNWKFFLFPAIGALIPIIIFFIWQNSPLAEGFYFVEENYFGRALLDFQSTKSSYHYAFLHAKEYDSAMAYFSLEMFAIILLPITALFFFKKSPALSIYSLVLFVFCLFSGSYQGMIRYILAAPVVFLTPAIWSKSKVFDKAWTLINILLLGLLSMLFAFDFWVA